MHTDIFLKYETHLPFQHKPCVMNTLLHKKEHLITEEGAKLKDLEHMGKVLWLS